MPVFLGLGGLFLTVLGARWWLVDEFGSSVPFYDQWNGEAATLYLPYLHGTFTWADLFTPHNEHRIALTKIEALFLLVVNGQWDPELQMVVNAVIMAAAATALAAALWDLAGRRKLGAIGFLVGLSFATPAAWENTLFGFQSQFYFLDLAAFCGLWALPFARTGSARWYAGVALLLFGLFSVGTGLVAPVAAVVVVLLHDAGTNRVGHHTWVTAGAGLLIAGLGVLLLPPFPEDSTTRAHSFVEVATIAASSLAWPFFTRGWMAAVIWAPSVWLAVRALRARTCHPVEAFLFGLAAWVTAHAVAIGWARGGVGFVSSRYMDILALAPVINGTVLALLLEWPQPRRISLALTLGAAAWIIGVVIGVSTLSRHAVLRDAPARRGTAAVFERNIRKLAKDGDLRSFDQLQYPAEVPWISPRELALEWLYDPQLRAVLPPSIRDPLPLEVEGSTAFTSPGAFQSTPARADFGVGSYGVEGDATQGSFRSRPLNCDSGQWLRFDVAGYLGSPSTSFALERADGSSTVMTIGEPPREGWRRIDVRCPAGPFRVTASDTSTTTWFAFGPPVELGWLGRLAGHAADSGRAVLIFGLMLAAFAVRSASSR